SALWWAARSAIAAAAEARSEPADQSSGRRARRLSVSAAWSWLRISMLSRVLSGGGEAVMVRLKGFIPVVVVRYIRLLIRAWPGARRARAPRAAQRPAAWRAVVRRRDSRRTVGTFR